MIGSRQATRLPTPNRAASGGVPLLHPGHIGGGSQSAYAGVGPLRPPANIPPTPTPPAPGAGPSASTSQCRTDAQRASAGAGAPIGHSCHDANRTLADGGPS